ncbi:hypothetical protein CRV24_004359 [Beauveria bassiana]|nr:hypothetical protein CRV24_004359 [Beauveria bassiana]KAH8710977.1 hypothetical protein HC256_007806 [Beauveria bassiana]
MIRSYMIYIKTDTHELGARHNVPIPSHLFELSPPIPRGRPMRFISTQWVAHCVEHIPACPDAASAVAYTSKRSDDASATQRYSPTANLKMRHRSTCMARARIRGLGSAPD